MHLLRRLFVSSLSIAILMASVDANALIVNGSYSGIITNTFVTGDPFDVPPPGTVVGGAFSFDSSLIPSTGGSYTSPLGTNAFSLSGSFILMIPFSDPPSVNNYFSVSSGGLDFSVGSNISGLSLDFPVPLSLLTNPGSISLAASNIGEGLYLNALVGQTFFDINSITLTSSAVPLPASLPLFVTAVASLGVFLRRRRTQITGSRRWDFSEGRVMG
jgi:hypothetical protein